MVCYTHLVRPVIAKNGGIIMGFLDAILHAAAISAIEARREVRQEEQRARVSMNQCLDVEDALNDLFSRTGNPAFYILSTRNYELEVSKMKDWMQSYKEYLSLGGEASVIKYAEDIDTELRFIKGLSMIGKISEQDKYRDKLEFIRRNTNLSDPYARPDSKEGFIESLSFGGIDRAGAIWLLEQCNVNWDKQAIRYAQEYIEGGYVHTKKQLINILFDAGFTEAQTRKATDSWKGYDNIDWDNQAIKFAQDCMECHAVSTKRQLINVMVYDGFTLDQAIKAADVCWKD